MTKLNWKPLAGVAVLVLAAGSVLTGLMRQGDAPRSAAGPAPAAAVVARIEPVTVYYFHADARCKTCRAIEAETARVVRQRFDAELADGRLAFEVVNIDAPAGQPFRARYELAFGSVVVQGAGAQQPWENLADVWTLIHGEPALFEAYVVDHVQRMLERSG